MAPTGQRHVVQIDESQRHVQIHMLRCGCCWRLHLLCLLGILLDGFVILGLGSLEVVATHLPAARVGSCENIDLPCCRRLSFGAAQFAHDKIVR